MAKGISIRLYNGNIPQINLNNLICLWWDQTDVYDFDTPIGRTNSATTDADGDLVLDLTDVSGLSTGGWGYLLVRREDVTDHRDSLVFQGRVQVDDYSNGTKLSYQTIESTWKRNPDWQTYTEPSTEKFVGLHAVFESGSNFLALSAEGNYTVDWGDGGSTENFNSGVVAYHTYDYTGFDSGKATQGSVSFVATDNTVYKVNHGRLDGETVSFASITTTTGITAGQIYYVINATDNTYQLSATENGSAIDLVNDGSGYTLKYKTVVVQVYPQNGQNLTKLNLHQKHNQSLLQTYSSGWLDISLYAPNCTDLRIGSYNADFENLDYFILFSYLEQVNIISSDLTHCSCLFVCCYSLSNLKNLVTSSAVNVTATCIFDSSVIVENHGFKKGDLVIFKEVTGTTEISDYNIYYVVNTTTDTFTISQGYGNSETLLSEYGTGVVVKGHDFSGMFYKCYSLKTIPLFNTSSGISFSGMFNACNSLESVPLFDTSNGIYLNSIFFECHSLKTTPLLNTSSGIFFTSMFYSCYSLESVPLLDTSSGTNINNMFRRCVSLKSIPLFDTSSSTSIGSMFYDCYSLKSVPLFNTSNGTSFTSMFSNCYSLESVPLFDTSSSTNFGDMFSNCYSLKTIPLFNTSNGTALLNMFQNCYSLESIPLLATSLCSDFSNMFYNCNSLESVPLLNVASANGIGSYYQMFLGCNSLSKGALSGTDQSISYASCKLSGAALDEIYTNLATVTGKTITVTNNWGTTSDTPSIATAKGWTVTS